MGVYNDYTARMIARFGFRTCHACVCPRVVAGKRCLVGYPSSWGSQERACVCQRYFGSILDHARIWLTGPRQYLLTAEPYDLDEKDEDVERFRTELAALGLELEVTNESYWFEHTRLLLVRRQ